MLNGRLPWWRPEELSAEQRKLYDTIVNSARAVNRPTPLTDRAGRLNGPFNAMLTSPDVGDRIQWLALGLRFGETVPRVVFEVVVLIVAAERAASYEWYAHAPIARAAGLSDEHLESIREHRYSDVEGVIGGAVLELVTASLQHRQPSEESVRGVESLYGARGVTELAVTVGHYDMVANLMRVWDSQLPDGVADPLNRPGAPEVSGGF